MKVVFGKNGIVEQLECNGANIIQPWSIECGDTASFFSLEQPGWRTEKTLTSLEIDESSAIGHMDVEMTDGKFELDYEYQHSKHEIVAEAKIKAEQNSLLMDFVQQYRFKKEHFEYGIINGQKITYTNSNKYYQFPVTEAELIGPKIKVEISLLEVDTTESFTPVMYIRDYRDMWIVHCRLLPKKVAREMVKLNVKWYNRAIPKAFSDALLKIPRLRHTIWYRGERDPYKLWQLPYRLLKPSAYELAELRSGEELRLKSRVKVYC